MVARLRVMQATRRSALVFSAPRDHGGAPNCVSLQNESRL
jgi:hypothetical protein